MTDRALASHAPSPTRCTAHTRVYRGGELVAEGFDVERVSDFLELTGHTVWLDLLMPDEADVGVLREELGLHPLAIEDALHEHQRPKLDRYPDHMFLAAYAAHLTGSDVTVAEVAAFITPNALVTVRKSPAVRLEPLVHRWDGAPRDLRETGVAFLVHGLLDALVDGYEDVVRQLGERADDLEDVLFRDGGARANDRDVQRRSYDLRTAVSRLRRVAVPVREVVATLRRRDTDLADDVVLPYLRDVDDHLARVLDGLESLRELLATVLDTTMALQGQRLNETIFRLTAWAAVLAATTAITGYFGQNVPFPGFGGAAGFWASTVLLVGAVGSLYAYFRRKGWL